MRIRTAKEAWTVEQWLDFGRRCQDVRDGIESLVFWFPETPGLKAQHLRRLATAHQRLYAAMAGAENVFVAQHPGRDNDAIRTIHGRGGNGVGNVSGRVRKEAKPLSREEWGRLGDRVKTIRGDVMALAMELQGTTRATKAYVHRFVAAVAAIDRAKCGFDSIVCRQHPGWPEATRVFYGPSAPEEEAG